MHIENLICDFAPPKKVTFHQRHLVSKFLCNNNSIPNRYHLRIFHPKMLAIVFDLAAKSAQYTS